MSQTLLFLFCLLAKGWVSGISSLIFPQSLIFYFLWLSDRLTYGVIFQSVPSAEGQDLVPADDAGSHVRAGYMVSLGYPGVI